MKKTSELASCSICGSKARVQQSKFGFGIDCSRCGNATPWFPSLDAAISEWNRRAQNEKNF